MTPQEQATLSALLGSEVRRLETATAGLVDELQAIVEASDLSNLDDEHDPEGATVGYERARVASLLDDVCNRLAEVAAAAERLGTGPFGECGGCRERIAFDRLLAYPTATACVSCADETARSPLHRRR